MILSRAQAAWFELFRLLLPPPQLCFSFTSQRKVPLAVPATAGPSAGDLALWLQLVTADSKPDHSLASLANLGLPLKNEVSAVIATCAAILTWTANCRGVRVETAAWAMCWAAAWRRSGSPGQNRKPGVPERAR